ncbi:WhiB family transcriptional regulator [Streptomyces pinistramenti]|uniref:WhiB family transcriptional regulator n=1 Tax=Streptomyces pinistramenti TaxID=2884812 RepID=UPI001D0630D3|nr:WhiB family transcriptional regulator [Streptomyces pinistramenti]MCB5905902.1 WhiB family transcriptional regulator [Streptomyces pinistramenti]
MLYITTDDAPPPALHGIADHNWHARSLCQGMDAAEADRLFFPAPRDHRAIAEARQICRPCPVRTECFNHALDNAIPEGIWGGLTASERLAWRKKAADRLDHNRVHAAFRGRDVHLSTPERKTVIRHAYSRGWRAERLAYVLGIDLDWARDQLRDEREAIDNRDRYALHQEPEPQEQKRNPQSPNTPGTGNAQGPHDGTPHDTPVPVDRQEHTPELIDQLGKAA